MIRHVLLSLVALSGMVPATATLAATDAERSLAAAAEAGKYAIVVFSKGEGPTTQAMNSVVQAGVAQREGRAVGLYVDVTRADAKPLVERFGLARAPLPITVAVAPNGAVTGIYAKTISAERLAKAFVSPGVADCMKVMQGGKMVFVWGRAQQNSALPYGVADFQRDAEFAGRAEVVALDLGDPAELSFFKELEIDAVGIDDAVALLAPPGVLVGTFGVKAKKEDIAAALHKAGKCCDDPNCKHNR